MNLITSLPVVSKLAKVLIFWNGTFIYVARECKSKADLKNSTKV